MNIIDIHTYLKYNMIINVDEIEFKTIDIGLTHGITN